MKKNTYILFLVLFVLPVTISAQRETNYYKILIISLLKNQDPIEKFLQNIIQQTVFDECITKLISNEQLEEQNKNIISHYQSEFTTIGFDSCKEPTAHSLNRIIKNAEAEFICLISGAYYLYPQTLQKSIRFLEKNHGQMAYSDFYVTYDPDVNLETNDYWYPAKYPMNCDISMISNAPFIIWKKDLHAAFGYFNEDYTFLFKEEFFQRIAYKHSAPIKIPGICGVLYFDCRSQKPIFSSPHEILTFYQEKKRLFQAIPRSVEKKSRNEKPFVIIIPSYNNEQWLLLNLDSAFNQEYDNYRIIYINDASTDRTKQLVSDYLVKHEHAEKATFITNNKRRGALENIYNAVHSCKKEEIIMLLDGDDHLADPYVLERLNAIYQDPNVWMTYGQFVWWPAMIPGSAQSIADEIINLNSFRECAWTATHLRTFYAGIFHKIHKEDLLYEKNFFPMAWDLALMFPMLEMAGTHSRFIPDLIYAYNTLNPLSDHATDVIMQQNLDEIIRHKAKYKRIEEL